MKENIENENDDYVVKPIRNEIKGDFSLKQFKPYSKNPFRIPSGQEFDEFCASVKENGVLEPITARFTFEKNESGDVYEIISGHSRVAAAKRVKLLTVPAYIVNMSDDEADVKVVEFNYGRKNMLPSDLGKALKLRLEALNRQGKRTDLTSVQNEQKSSRGEVAGQFGVSSSKVYRYIRLAYLIQEFQNAVDFKKILLSVAENISFLRESEQKILLQLLPESKNGKKSLTRPQSAMLKKARQTADNANQTADLTENEIQDILNFKKEKKKKQKGIMIPYEYIDRYIAKHFESQELTEEDIQDIILKALENYTANNVNQ